MYGNVINAKMLTMDLYVDTFFILRWDWCCEARHVHFIRTRMYIFKAYVKIYTYSTCTTFSYEFAQ